MNPKRDSEDAISDKSSDGNEAEESDSEDDLIISHYSSAESAGEGGTPNKHRRGCLSYPLGYKISPSAIP